MKDFVDLNKYSLMLILQENINLKLRNAYELNKDKGREHLSAFLVNFVEEIIDEINLNGHRFGRCDYSGDINFENSEQIFSDGVEQGNGFTLHFRGFSVLLYWQGADEYSN